VLKDVEKLAAMFKSARIALQPIVTLQKLDKNGLLKKIGFPPFNAFLSRDPGDYAFRGGLMDIKVFELIGNDLNLNTTGTIGLPEPQPLNLRVVMKLAAGSIGETWAIFRR